MTRSNILGQESMLTMYIPRSRLTSTTLRSFGSRRYYASTSNTAAPRPLRLAIVGSGPSGFYAASKILQTLPIGSQLGGLVEIDMFDRLPTPYGLSRYGVAPDHPEVKNCQHKFDELENDPRFRFFGNVCVGSTHSPIPGSKTYDYPDALHLPLSALFETYNTLLFSYGSSLSRALPSTPGSSSSSDRLDNVFPALAFVNWYNGHPAYSHLAPDLSGETATVVGHGNVAVDCARILLKNPEEFVQTDMPSHIVDTLKKSRVKRVELVGRRGPAQVAFTTKEFREMVNLQGVKYTPPPAELMNEAKTMIEGDRAKKRLLDLMVKGGKKDLSIPEDKEFRLEFLKSPKAFLGGDAQAPTKVASVEWHLNTLLNPPASSPSPSPESPAAPPTSRSKRPCNTAVARPTGESVTTKTGMVIESVGYKAEPVVQGDSTVKGWEFPFDQQRATIMNREGRVTDLNGDMVSTC